VFLDWLNHIFPGLNVYFVSGIDWKTVPGVKAGSQYFIGNLKYQWSDARLYCRMRGGYLLENNNKTELQMIFNHLVPTPSGERFWTGANDLVKENEFVWEYSLALVRPDVFSSGEPSNGGIFQNEDCAVIGYNDQTTLDDFACGDKYIPFCKRKI